MSLDVQCLSSSIHNFPSSTRHFVFFRNSKMKFSTLTRLLILLIRKFTEQDNKNLYYNFELDNYKNT